MSFFVPWRLRLKGPATSKRMFASPREAQAKDFNSIACDRTLGAYRSLSWLLIVDNPLVPQLLQKLADVGANLGGIRVAKLGLQFSDDLAEGTLPVAALQHLPSRALQLDRAFGKQDYALLFAPSPAATGRQARLAGILRRRHAKRPRS